jgi:hypothetical protein
LQVALAPQRGTEVDADDQQEDEDRRAGRGVEVGAGVHLVQRVGAAQRDRRHQEVDQERGEPGGHHPVEELEEPDEQPPHDARRLVAHVRGRLPEEPGEDDELVDPGQQAHGQQRADGGHAGGDEHDGQRRPVGDQVDPSCLAAVVQHGGQVEAVGRGDQPALLVVHLGEGALAELLVEVGRGAQVPGGGAGGGTLRDGRLGEGRPLLRRGADGRRGHEAPLSDMSGKSAESSGQQINVHLTLSRRSYLCQSDDWLVSADERGVDPAHRATHRGPGGADGPG